MLLNCGVGEDSWESFGLQGDPPSPSQRKSVLNINWKDWCWSWNSNSLATWSEDLTHWKRSWCWARLKLAGEGDNRGWDGWMASLTRRTWEALGIGDGQGSLTCCSPWGRKESDQTEWLNWTEMYKIWIIRITWYLREISTMNYIQNLSHLYFTPIHDMLDSLVCNLPSFSICGISGKKTGLLPWPPSGDLPDPGIKPVSLALQADSLPAEPFWESLG